MENGERGGSTQGALGWLNGDSPLRLPFIAWPFLQHLRAPARRGAGKSRRSKR